MQIRTVPLNSTPVKVIRFDPDKDTIGQLSSNLRNSIFLAGPCPRKDYNNDWRNEAFKILASLGFEGQVITPTNARFQELRNKYGEEALKQQTLWEMEAMKKASALVFWVDRHIDAGFPAFTTNIEFGDWYAKEGVYVGFPDGADKNEYLKCRMDIAGIPYFTDLRDMLAAVVSNLNREGSAFFTSDTHFSQQRTLELSRRPFKTTHEMDLEMISNWNMKRFSIISTYYYDDYEGGLLKQGSKRKIKRIIAMPNETFKIEKSKLYVLKGDQYEQIPYTFKIEPDISQEYTGKDIGETHLGADEYWVLGDHRDKSRDSGTLGKQIKKGYILGVLVAIEGQARLKIKNYVCNNCGKTYKEGSVCANCFGTLSPQYDLANKQYHWPKYY